ncbi:WecB/TagA/CpsF family glycosyltransferase [Algibacter lectus]|uniref:N-acetylglucosaminyldiphosphoundecaprenol N-acetyl-beta-D-mannosaminyltransferase n=1 Tax=Algibacter lectus TaxID=221126 RepID=A0A4R8M5P7_9FLAO|nr:WecB/TagA/CpsF family glycosyltransferase [Algibacter lectus]MWW25904.1 WecB/TagA/CpsF family glycosyltransferase [Algibacter lectus]TDY60630.1 N-acetylglucosaminyldiphosphoundecaprenol N-acetyl-beta-D-mannosaminyltransferase [Algibacter lectus]
MQLKDLVDNKVYTNPISEISIDNKSIINTINPHSYCEAKKDSEFTKALLSSDVLLPDGSGIVLASKILSGKTINKIAGADIHQYLLEQANLKGDKVFYLGASENTLQLIEKRIAKDYPNISVSSYSPPYKPEFTSTDTSKMLAAVNSFNPKILFVGMTAPKQEKWVYANQTSINANIVTSIGAVFDFYAGTVKRSSPFWIKLGLEWLPRLVREPKRLWKRNFVSTPLFLWDLLKTKCGI